MNIKKLLLLIYLLGLVFIPLVLIFLPSNFFDNGESVCVSVLLFDQECPGCGMTRGVQHLLHFDITTAYEYNKLSLLVLPLLVFLWVKETNRVKNMLFNIN